VNELTDSGSAPSKESVASKAASANGQKPTNLSYFAIFLIMITVFAVALIISKVLDFLGVYGCGVEEETLQLNEDGTTSPIKSGNKGGLCGTCCNYIVSFSRTCCLLVNRNGAKTNPRFFGKASAHTV